MDASAKRDEPRTTNWTAGGWRRAARCASNGCVEARVSGDEVTLRSSKDPDGPSVSYDRDEWTTFVAAVKAGEFDVA